MRDSSWKIQGGDYDRGGLASRNLKEQLKKIGAAPDVLRRVMIAAYEAEMNVVIHARGGVMKALLDDRQVHIEVTDEGPGIADIALAMKEGYSTAPAPARELGFGAGLGLPNIRKNSDRFTIESTVGVGTQICFTIQLRPQEEACVKPNSLGIEASRCTQCLRCLHSCPTRALRIRQSRPENLDYLCVDCTSCIAVCPAGALTLQGSTAALHPAADNVLVVPPAFLAMFEPESSGEQVLSALAELGFTSIILTESAERSQRLAAKNAALECARTGSDGDGPVISGICPAVVNLIETKFPSLLKNVAPFLSPLEAVREELAGRRATFVVLCPAQKTLVGAGGGPDKADIILPSLLESKLRPLLLVQKKVRSAAEPAADGEAELLCEKPEIVRVSGMAHVVRVLEEIENGRMMERCLLELHACDEGCFGSPLLRKDPFLSRRDYRAPAEALIPAFSAQKAIRRRVPLAARPGLRLDANMAKAIQKLSQLDQLLRTLPGYDCGYCGCPTCGALAEDVVLGRSAISACTRQRELLR